MEHKYYMSQRERRDVGLVAALTDYARLRAHRETERRTFGDIIRGVTQFLRGAGENNIYLS
jgi:hypothetical protein